MNVAEHRRRGRPPRVARDIAVMLAVEWHVRAEGLPTGRAIGAVRELWHAQGRVGLGCPSLPSNAAFGCMRRASAILGEGRIVIQKGIEAGPMLIGAAAFFVPTSSTLRHTIEGRQAIYGPFWQWLLGAEEAAFVNGNDAPAPASPSLKRTADLPGVQRRVSSPQF